MKTSKPLFQRILIAAATGLLALSAQAQTTPAWPQKTIKLFVGTPPGSAPDLIARILGDKLSRGLGQPVVIENKPGAGGIVAVGQLRAAAPDGYTIALLHASAAIVTPHTFKEANYDVDRDLETFAMAGRTPMMFVTQPDSPAKTLADAVAMARAKPDQVSIGNPTRTSIPHLASELAAMTSNIKFQQVSFANTGQGIQAVVNKDINLYVDGVGPLMQLVKAGKLKALAVTSEDVLPGLEGFALANKSVPGLDVYGWFSMQAPKGTPPAILERLNTEMNNAMRQPDVVAKFREFGTYPTIGTVADAQKFVQGQNKLFGNMIRTLGMKAE